MQYIIYKSPLYLLSDLFNKAKFKNDKERSGSSRPSLFLTVQFSMDNLIKSYYPLKKPKLGQRMCLQLTCIFHMLFFKLSIFSILHFLKYYLVRNLFYIIQKRTYY